MAYPPVTVVDEDDQEIGSAMLAEVWAKRLIHRVVFILVKDEQGRLLLQKRSEHMNLYPNCWDFSAAGHVDKGFSYDEAARRELAEELGLHNVPLIEVVHYRTYNQFEGRHMDRFAKLYQVVVDPAQAFNTDEHEVSKVQWFTKAQIEQLITGHSDQATDELVQALKQYY